MLQTLGIYLDEILPIPHLSFVVAIFPLSPTQLLSTLCSIDTNYNTFPITIRFNQVDQTGSRLEPKLGAAYHSVKFNRY